MKNKTKLLSVILSIVMAFVSFNIVPVSVFAAEDNGDTDFTISFTPKYSYEYIENVNGYWETDWDENKYFVYNSPNFENGDKLSITYPDERGTVDYYYDDSWWCFKNDEGHSISLIDIDRSKGRGWTVGGENSFTITYMDKSVDVPVALVKPEDASARYVPVKPYELIENRDGEEYDGYFEYDTPELLTGDKITVDYGDKTVTYTYAEKSQGFYDENGQELDYAIRDDQNRIPWTLGTNNCFIIIAAGKTMTVPVTIIEYPVESIEFKLASPIIIYENQDGYYFTENGAYLYTDENGYYYYSYSEEGEEKVYTEPAGFRYNQIPVYKDGNQLIVHNKDGSVKTLTQRFVFTEEDHGYYFVDENGDYDSNVSFNWGNQETTPFKLGDDNQITVQYLDTATAIPVTVVENNIESIEYQPIRPVVYNLDDPKDVYDWSNGRKLGYYYNPQKLYETGSVLTARFKDGTTKKYTMYSSAPLWEDKYYPFMGSPYWSVDEEGSVIGYSSLDFDHNTKGWASGNTYDVTVRYLGASTKIPVIITGGEAETLEIGDINGDGGININDATMIQKYLAELETLTPEQLKAADTDGDGNININDATNIQKFIAELIDRLG